MIDEKDLSHEKRWFYETLPKTVLVRLKKNNVHAEYVRDRKKALKKTIEYIPRDATIGFGDSVTLHQIGLFSHLEGEPDRVLFNSFAIEFISNCRTQSLSGESVLYSFGEFNTKHNTNIS